METDDKGPEKLGEKPKYPKKENRPKPEPVDIRYPRLKDIIGPESFRNKLEDIVQGIKSPFAFKLYGLNPDKTFLFYGPPGTGKTMTALAIRNELANSGQKVLWAPYDIERYGTAYINMGAVTLQDYFDNTKELVEDGTYDSRILFFDECDTLMGKRNDRNASKEDDKVLEALMKNLNSINLQEENDTYVILATNFRKVMDEASIRAGRVNNHLEFPLPNVDALESAYKYEIHRINNRAKWHIIKDYTNIRSLAEKSVGMSYADVHTLVESTVKDRVGKLLHEVLLRDDGDKSIIKAPHILLEDIANRLDKHKATYVSNNSYYEVNKKKIGFG